MSAPWWAAVSGLSRAGIPGGGNLSARSRAAAAARPVRSGNSRRPARPDAGTSVPVERLNAWRLHSQWLDRPFRGRSLLDVVRSAGWLYSPGCSTPYLALRARAPRFRSQSLDRLVFRDRKLVQVETLRGCTMLVPREHAAVALKIRSRTFTHLARQARTLMPVTEKELDRLRMAVVDVLSSGAANYEEIEGRVPQELVRPFPAALRKLGLTGSLWLAINLLKEEGRVVKIQTVGRLDSTEYAFAQVSDVVGDDEVSGLRGELAIQELVRLYFLTEGPARMRDFAWWAGIHVTDGMRAAEGLGDSLVPIEVDGSREEFLIPRSRLEEFRSFRPEPTPTVNFLPYRDPYLKGQREIVNRFVRDEHFDKPFSRWKGKLINDALATVLWNGRVVGLWEWTHASGVDYVLFDEEAVDIAPQVEKQAAALDTFIREDLGSFRLQGLDYGRNQMTGIRELSSHWGQGAQAAVG